MNNNNATVMKKWLYVWLYVLIWAAQALMVKASKINGHYPYNIFSTTLSIEFCKLVLAYLFYLYLRQRNPEQYPEPLEQKWHVAKFFAIPAAIYCIYNALAFVNLRLLEPATYRVLINVRVLLSGLLFQTVFAKTLAPKQWLALVLLLVGCIVEQSSSFVLDGGLLALLLMTIQASSSSLGGVYFQWLLQREDTQNVGLWEKNIFLYAWGSVFNIFFIVLFQPQLVSPTAFFEGYNMTTVGVVFLGALGGFTTSLLLQNLDVVAKEYSNFLEMIIVALGARAFFGSPLHLSLLTAIAVVSVSIVLYNRGEEEQARLEADLKNPNKFKGSSCSAGAASPSGSINDSAIDVDELYDPDDDNPDTAFLGRQNRTNYSSTSAHGNRAEADAQAMSAARSYDEFVLNRYAESDEAVIEQQPLASKK